MLVILGFMIIILCVFGGFSISGGHLFALFQPIELIMIGGSALGAFLVGNNIKVIVAAIKGSCSTLKSSPYTRKFNIELLSMYFEITNKIRKDGALSIEADIENYQESPLFSKYPLLKKDAKLMEFLCDHLRLIITGRVDHMQLEAIMDTDIDTFEEESELPIAAINKIADSLPAFGIVAAVMGVVHTMESIGVAPAILGGLIAKALVGTFLGVLIGYGFIAPIASAVDSRRQACLKILLSVKVVLLASVNEMAPAIGVELARKVLYSSYRPNSKELENILREIKNPGTKEANV
jgi:chemotaxis protein MotA